MKEMIHDEVRRVVGERYGNVAESPMTGCGCNTPCCDEGEGLRTEEIRGVQCLRMWLYDELLGRGETDNYIKSFPRPRLLSGGPLLAP